MLGPFATASRYTFPFTRCRYCRTPPLSQAACASMSTTTTTTTTTTTRDRGDRYGPMEWAQLYKTTNKVSLSEAMFPSLIAFGCGNGLSCCPLSNAFEAVTHSYRRLENQPDRIRKRDRQTCPVPCPPNPFFTFDVVGLHFVMPR